MGRWPSDFINSNFTSTCHGNTSVFLFQLINSSIIQKTRNTHQVLKIINRSISLYHLLSHVFSRYASISYPFYCSRKEDSKYWGKTLMTKKKKIQVTIYPIILEQLNPKLISPLLFPCFFSFT